MCPALILCLVVIPSNVSSPVFINFLMFTPGHVFSCGIRQLERSFSSTKLFIGEGCSTWHSHTMVSDTNMCLPICSHYCTVCVRESVCVCVRDFCNQSTEGKRDAIARQQMYGYHCAHYWQRTIYLPSVPLTVLFYRQATCFHR